MFRSRRFPDFGLKKVCEGSDGNGMSCVYRHVNAWAGVVSTRAGKRKLTAENWTECKKLSLAEVMITCWCITTARFHCADRLFPSRSSGVIAIAADRYCCDYDIIGRKWNSIEDHNIQAKNDCVQSASQLPVHPCGNNGPTDIMLPGVPLTAYCWYI